MRRSTHAEFLRRLVAAGSAALVLALTIVAASPRLHDQLHAGHAHEAEEGCAVTLFAGGVSPPLGALEIAAPTIAWREQAPATATEIVLTAPRYLLLPERGPPVS
jgi:hypothetical protein